MDNPSVSNYFIISAIIVKEQNIDQMREAIKKTQEKYFPKGEIKSSRIGSKHEFRKRILAETLTLPFSVFAVVIDKQQLINSKGLRYKPSFYKFLNNIVHKELRRAFGKLTIVADEIGGSEYMQSFSKYVAEQQEPTTLFGESDFEFQNSKNDVLIQLADLISGTLSYIYEKSKQTADVPNYMKMLDKKFTRVEMYPKTFVTYNLETSALAEGYDKDIAKLCLKQASDFINKHENSIDEDVQAQIIVLGYLRFRFMNNDLRDYISTKELRNQLSQTTLADISIQSFRLRIIGKLRDDGVIIASSPKGYKIPSKQSELYDFVNHGTSIIVPMLERLKKCRDLVKLGTANELDIFDHTEYGSLKKYFDG